MKGTNKTIDKYIKINQVQIIEELINKTFLK
jgi:hypothetical protein